MQQSLQFLFVACCLFSTSATGCAVDGATCGVGALLQRERSEGGQVLVSESPYVLNKTDTKCAHQNNDRLFREEGLDVDGCYSKCSSTANCNYFSIATEGRYAGVCMGCTLGITDIHNQFNFYNMGSGGSAAATSTTTTTAAPSAAGYVLNQTNTKCAYRHPDRLFRVEGSNTHDCFVKCSNTPNCNYFSIAMEGQYTGVCMGCVQGVTQPHEHFKFYTMPVVEPPPDLPDHCEDMAYEQRVDCGWWGVTPEACLEKGCCWQVDPVPNPNHIPYCYRHHTVLPACEMSNEVKTDCGYFGIGADECEARGCCYRQSPNPNPSHVPWCFHPAE